MAAQIAELPVLEDDAALVRRYADGDSRAFEALVRRYQESVLAIALRFANDMDDARDLAQRAFIQAMDKAHSWRGAGSFKGWLYRIVVNLAKNHLRSAARTAPEESAPEPSATPEHEARMDAQAERVRLREAILRLPRRQREVVLLRVDADLGFGEVGAILGVTENSAKVSYHHALQKLRSMLEGVDG